jgi:predicted nucleotidyltransferase component of viral defense system
MRDHVDRRVVPEWVLGLVRRIQANAPCDLGGGAALSGAHLDHRLSHDIDLFFRSPDALRALAAQLVSLASEAGVEARIVQDAGSFVRATLQSGAQRFDVDLVLESTEPLAPSETIEAIRLMSLDDLRASKITCLLSRSEPRDLVDVLFLDRAGFRPELDLAGAVTKDAGVDPSALAWLLTQFPVEPLPQMLSPLTAAELREFRDALSERLRKVALDEG